MQTHSVPSADALIGHTGFVGTTLGQQRAFAGRYRSTDIHTLPQQAYDTIYCAGAPGKKWLANKEPQADAASIARLQQALAQAHARRVVLISTVDVFGHPVGVDEESIPAPNSPYGRHRRDLEQFVDAHFEQALVVRLPGLVGHGLRKNALYDLAHDRPLGSLSAGDTFQFYPVAHLSGDIDRALAAGLRCVHLTAAPTALGPLAEHTFGRHIPPRRSGADLRYDVQTRYAALWQSVGRYQYSESQVQQAVRGYATDVRQA